MLVTNMIRPSWLRFWLLAALFFSSPAWAQLKLSVIPSEAHTNADVTLTIEIAEPEGEVEVNVLAQRIDSDNDGVIDSSFEMATPVSNPAVVKDLGRRLPYAKDRNPQLKKIQYSFSSPSSPGDYWVRVKPKDGPPDTATQEPLLVYSRQVQVGDNEAFALGRLPSKVPKPVLAELYRSLRRGETDRSGQPAVWMVDRDRKKTQLTTAGSATDPTWAPPGKRERWLAYSYKASPDAAFNVWILDTATPSNRRQLTFSEKDDLSPMWSPDGSKIAFVRGDSVYVSHIDREHGEESIVTQSGLQQILSWDAKSGSIVYLTVVSDKRVKQIWAVDLKSKTRKALAYNPLWGLIRSVAASKRGDRLLFEWKSRTSKNVDIFALDFPALTSANLTEDFHQARCMKPSLSANGEEVAFVVIPID